MLSSESELHPFVASVQCLMSSDGIWAKVCAKTYANGQKFRMIENGKVILRPGGKSRDEGGQMHVDFCWNGQDFVNLLRRVDYPFYVSLLEGYLQREDGFVLKFDDVWNELEFKGWTKAKRFYAEKSDDWYGIGECVYLPPNEFSFPDEERINKSADEIMAWIRVIDKELFDSLANAVILVNRSTSKVSSSNNSKLSDPECQEANNCLPEEMLVHDSDSVQSPSLIRISKYDNKEEVESTDSVKHCHNALTPVIDDECGSSSTPKTTYKYDKNVKNEIEITESVKYANIITNNEGDTNQGRINIFEYGRNVLGTSTDNKNHNNTANTAKNSTTEAEDEIIKIGDDLFADTFVACTKISSLRFHSAWIVLQKLGWKRENGMYYAPGFDDPIDDVILFLDNTQESPYDEMRMKLRDNFLRRYYYYDECNAFLCGTLVSSLDFLKIWSFLDTKYDWGYSDTKKYLPPSNVAGYLKVGNYGLDIVQLLGFLDGNNDIIIKDKLFIHEYRHDLRKKLLTDYFLLTDYYEKHIRCKNRDFQSRASKDVNACDICFRLECKPDIYYYDDKGGPAVSQSFITCSTCGLYAHEYCYDSKEEHINDRVITCEICSKTRQKKKHASSIELLCVLCLKNDYPLGMKLTADKKKWVHIFCATNTKETYFRNDGICGYKKALSASEASTKGFKCEVCKNKGGYLVKCWTKTCQKYHHSLCAELAKRERKIGEWNDELNNYKKKTVSRRLKRYNCEDHSVRFSCKICKERGKSEDIISCNGYCGDSFHLACVGLFHLPHDWYCHTCSKTQENQYSSELQTSKKRATDIENGAATYFNIKRKTSRNVTKKGDVELFNAHTYCILPPPSEIVEKLSTLKRKHQHEVNVLKTRYSSYDKWSFILKTGHSLCLFGFGSKQDIIEKFSRKVLKYEGDIVNIEGYNSDFQISDLLEFLISSILGEDVDIAFDWEIMHHIGTQIEYNCFRSSIAGASKLAKRAACFARQASQILQRPLFLTVHNIDAPSLFNSESQSILSCLVAFSNRMIRLIASCDNVNIFDAWDSAAIARYQWSFEDVTTYERYNREILSLEPLTKKSTHSYRSQTIVKGISKVLYSLAQRHSEILRELAIIVSKRKSSDSSNLFVGVSYKEFLKHCRDKMLVNSDTKLRETMGELLDHSIMIIRKTNRGEELVDIPEEAIDEILQTLQR